MRGLTSLVNDNHVDNNLNEILVYVYSGSIVNTLHQTLSKHLSVLRFDPKSRIISEFLLYQIRITLSL